MKSKGENLALETSDMFTNVAGVGLILFDVVVATIIKLYFSFLFCLFYLEFVGMRVKGCMEDVLFGRKYSIYKVLVHK